MERQLKNPTTHSLTALRMALSVKSQTWTNSAMEPVFSPGPSSLIAITMLTIGKEEIQSFSKSKTSTAIPVEPTISNFSMITRLLQDRRRSKPATFATAAD